MKNHSLRALTAALLSAGLQGQAQAQPYQVEDIAVGPASSFGSTTATSWTGSVGDVLLFSADNASDGVEPWRSNGTAQGTFMLRDIGVGSASSNPGAGGAALGRAPVVGTSALFRATTTGGYAGMGMWRTDGTTAGTVLVSNTPAGFGYGTPFEAGVLFAGDSSGKVNLWKTDGTGAGTSLVRTFYLVQRILNLGGGVALVAASDGTGVKLYRTNGTGAGTSRLSDVALNVELHGDQDSVLGTEALFIGNGVLWKTDGTDTGTALLSNTIVAPGAGANGEAFVKAGSSVFFAGAGSGRGIELWKSDGTASGTLNVKHVRPEQLIALGNTLYFVAHPSTKDELWKSDGTDAGTLLVRGGFTSIANLYAYRGVLYFSGNSGQNGEELWTSDGSNAGTTLVADLSAGGDSSPSMFTGVGNTLYFAADDGVSGRELWAMSLPSEVVADAGVPDAGALDSGTPPEPVDGGPDAGATDAGGDDAMLPEAADAGATDAGNSSADDAGVMDAGTSASSDADSASNPRMDGDAAETDSDVAPGRPSSDGCSVRTARASASRAATLLWMAVLGLALRRRKPRQKQQRQ